jgi:hypothetical protein
MMMVTVSQITRITAGRFIILLSLIQMKIVLRHPIVPTQNVEMLVRAYQTLTEMMFLTLKITAPIIQMGQPSVPAQVVHMN